MLRLLIDEDIKARSLIQLLKNHGHDVVSTSDLNLNGSADESVLAKAQDSGRVLLTYNCDDFRILHGQGIEHSGIVVVYQEPGKSMSYAEIARALDNLKRSGSLGPGTFHALNFWHF